MKTLFTKGAITLFSILGLAVVAFAAPEVGQPAPNFTAQDINGKTVSLSACKGRIVVMETFYSGCAWCKNHYGTGAMQELQRELTTNGVVWLLIGCQRNTRVLRMHEDTPASAKKIWAQAKMVITGWIADTDGQIARAYAMRTTPQMFVIDKNGVLAYQGALDDHPDPDGDPRTARNYVREAVRALLAGKKVPVPQTKPYGCRLLYDGMSVTGFLRFEQACPASGLCYCLRCESRGVRRPGTPVRDPVLRDGVFQSDRRIA